MKLRGVAAAALLLGGGCAHRGIPLPTDPPAMVAVPAGGFTMGSARGALNERPEHRVKLRGFAIDRTEVSAAEFADFLTAAGNAGEQYFSPGESSTVVLVGGGADRRFQARPGYERHPANNISWNGADAYCRWRGKRLPTEAEWEKAARGTDARPFPWGEAPPADERARFGQSWEERGLDVLAPVDAREAGSSPYGALNMSGNVLEWVRDWYRQNLCDFCSPLREADLPLARLLAGGEGPPPAAGEAERQSPTRVDPRGPAEGAFRVLRGGAWSDGDPEALTASRRFWLGPEQRFPDTGFRCAR